MCVALVGVGFYCCLFRVHIHAFKPSPFSIQLDVVTKLKHIKTISNAIASSYSCAKFEIDLCVFALSSFYMNESRRVVFGVGGYVDKNHCIGIK